MFSHFVGVDEMDLGRDPAPPRPPYRILDDLEPSSVDGQGSDFAPMRYNLT
jgi:hypothetical protein